MKGRALPLYNPRDLQQSIALLGINVITSNGSVTCGSIIFSIIIIIIIMKVGLVLPPRTADLGPARPRPSAEVSSDMTAVTKTHKWDKVY